jgi:hypothetical protein
VPNGEADSTCQRTRGRQRRGKVVGHRSTTKPNNAKDLPTPVPT